MTGNNQSIVVNMPKVYELWTIRAIKAPGLGAAWAIKEAGVGPPVPVLRSEP